MTDIYITSHDGANRCGIAYKREYVEVLSSAAWQSNKKTKYLIYAT